MISAEVLVFKRALNVDREVLKLCVSKQWKIWVVVTRWASR